MIIFFPVFKMSHWQKILESQSQNENDKWNKNQKQSTNKTTKLKHTKNFHEIKNVI